MTVTLDVSALSPIDRVALRAMLDTEMARDNSYQETPVGREVARFLDWQRWNSRSPKTIANREGPLRLLALETLDGRWVTMADLDGRLGARVIEAFLIRGWGRYEDNTRANRAGVLRAFMRWAYREGLVEKNPMDFVDTPRRRGRRRDAHPRDRIQKLISAQPTVRERIAIELMARQGLRKGEMAAVQLGHFNFAERTLSIFGKGSKFSVATLFSDLADTVERYAMERAIVNPDGWRDEHLVYPRRAYKRGAYPAYTWHEKEYRDRQLSSSALQEWWRNCLDRARLQPFPMHELRHTAGTEFHYGPAGRDYELTRQFLRHEDVATTATYIHSPPGQVAEKIRSAPDYWETDD